MKGRGLAFKLIVSILASVTIIFFIAFYYGHLASEDAVFDTVQESARNLTLATVNEIELALRGIERISLQHAYLMEQYHFPLEGLQRLLASTVSNNPEIYGSAIAFQPYAFDPKANHFAPYCYRDPDGQLKEVFLGGEEYDYFTMEWYRVPEEGGNRSGVSLIWTRAGGTLS